MWVFLSRRLRTWLILAIGVPLARAAVCRAAAAAQHRNPNGSAGRWLGRADSALASVSRRRTKHR